MQSVLTLLAVALAPTYLPAQDGRASFPGGLRGKLVELFVFGSGRGPLGLADPDETSPRAFLDRSNHFVSSTVENNMALIDFLENAIAANVSNIPSSSTNSSFQVQFRDGKPVIVRSSPGPIFAERARTLGAGRVLVATNLSTFRFTTLRGTNLDNLRLNFTHANVDFEGCDSLAGGDCSRFGIPTFENDFIQVDVDLNLHVSTLSFVLAYGLADRIDLGLAVPIVFTSLRGNSRAQLMPLGEGSAVHFFDGTPTAPQLISDPNFVEGSASGIGDLAIRVKFALADYESAQLAMLGVARFATGSKEDFLGSGDFAFRGLGIFSTTFGDFSPHANVGYLYRAGDQQNDAVLATAGFDQVIASWATLAVDLISRFQTGDRSLDLPDPVLVEEPFLRLIDATTIPDTRDDIIDGSIGFKFATPSGFTLIVNSIWPLNRGGVRSNVVLTAGLEYNL
jgi:hypothetical protein